MDRRLVSIRTVSEVAPIEGADNIVRIRVDGWDVVAKRGEFAPGDQCVYFELDSFLPASDSRFDFLAKTKRTWRGREGYRLRTVKLRGQVSQGLALPVAMFPEGVEALAAAVDKWEMEVPAQMRGIMAGNFPAFLRKSDQERIQNCFDEIDKAALYEVTLKLDGTSLTVFRKDGVLRVCSRNVELKTDPENADNLYVRHSAAFAAIPEGFAVQAEICGPGIQGNRMGLSEERAFVFDVFDIGAGVFIDPDRRRRMCDFARWPHVPIIATEMSAPASVDEALSSVEKLRYADCGAPAEGVVFKRVDGLQSFKIINNKFLLQFEDA